MIKNKWIIPILVISLLMFGAVPWAYADEADESVTAPVESYAAEYQQQYDVLNVLGIMQSSDLSKEITRGEFVAQFVNLCGYTEEQATAKRYFVDVAEDYSYIGQIAFAVERQLITGDNGNFRPDDIITAEEAASVALAVLGYNNFSPYVAMDMVRARREGIFNGISANENDKITWDSAAGIIYNTMNSSMIIIEGISVGSNGSSYMLNKNETTALNYYKHIYMDRGIVSDNGLTALRGESAVGETRVQIGDRIYMQNGQSFIDLLGHMVEAYYDEDDAILCVRDITQQNGNVLHIEADDIISAEMGSITFYAENGTDRTMRFLPTADIIYNGKALNQGEFTPERLMPKIGSVDLIRSGNNGYDVVIVTSQYNCVVEKSIHNGLIYTFVDTDTPEKNVDVDENYLGKTCRVTDASGSDVNLADITKNNVLSVAKSLDGELINIKVSTDSRKAWVDATFVSDEPPRLLSNGIDYRFAYGANTDEVKPNIFAWLDLDVHGNVANFRSYEKYEKRFAYLIDVEVDDSVFTSQIAIKIFDPSGKVLVLSSGDNVVLDGETIRPKDYDKIAERFYSGTELQPQIIQYELDLDGTLQSIDSRVYNEGVESETSTRLLEAPKTMERTNTGVFNGLRFYWSGSRTFDGQLYIDADTLVFGIPTGPHEDEDYVMLTSSYFINQRYYDVECYTSNPEGRIAEAMVVKYTAKYDESNVNDKNFVRVPSLYPSAMETAIVKKVYESVGEDGEPVCNVDLHLLSGADRNYNVRWSDLNDQFREGYVVRFFVLNNRIIDAEMVFDLNTMTPGTPRKFSSSANTFVVRQNGRDIADSSTTDANTPQFSLPWSLAYLDVLSVEDGMLTGVTADADGEWTEENVDYFRLDLINNGGCCYYNRENHVIEPVPTTDILSRSDGGATMSKVLTLSVNTTPRGLIIID